jgi:nucleoside-binding protein
VLLQNTDSTAVLQTAEKNGKFAFGWDSDMSAFAPKAHLASATVNWAPYYEKAVADVLNNTWQTGVSRWGYKEGAVEVIKITDKLPDPVKKRIEEVKAGLKAGSFEVFTGPIVTNEGKEVLAKDVKADDAWKGEVKFYVKGVEGKVPGGQ